jgi:DNA primase
LLLQKPDLFSNIKSDITVLNLPGSELLKEIYEVLKQDSTLNTASLLEYFRDKSDSAFLHRLAAWEHGVPEEGIVLEFQGIVSHLMKQQHQSNIENLLKKANLNTLTEEERKILQTMLGEKM